MFEQNDLGAKYSIRTQVRSHIRQNEPRPESVFNILPLNHFSNFDPKNPKIWYIKSGAVVGVCVVNRKK